MTVNIKSKVHEVLSWPTRALLLSYDFPLTHIILTQCPSFCPWNITSDSHPTFNLLCSLPQMFLCLVYNDWTPDTVISILVPQRGTSWPAIQRGFLSGQSFPSHHPVLFCFWSPTSVFNHLICLHVYVSSLRAGPMPCVWNIVEFTFYVNDYLFNK